MEAILLGIYAFFVWLVFFKFKWLPWNTASKVVVITIPVIGITALILTLNVVAPSASEVRVVNKVLQVVPQVRGRVIEVVAEGNRSYKKGAVLLRIDPTPYQNTVNRLQSKLQADDSALESAKASARQLSESLRAAAGQVSVVESRLGLAQRRLAEYEELYANGAGDLFALEEARASVMQIKGDLDTAKANESQVMQQLSAQSRGEYAAIASARAQLAATQADLDNAKWELDQTVYTAPSDGKVVNLQVRVGTMLTPMPFNPAFSFVEDEQELLAFYSQNELHMIESGNEAEVALLTRPGQVVKAVVDSVVWAQGQGQVAQGGMLPTTGVAPTAPNRFAVKLKTTGEWKNDILPAGSVGTGAVYTNHGKMIHILRKVLIRVTTKMNYLILKLH
jgi:multidrug resistance efflux pump